MVVFNWLKEWSPVLNLVVVVFIAVIIFLLQRRMHLRTQIQNEIDELRVGANEAWELANEYFLAKRVIQNLKDRTGQLIKQQFRLEILVMSLGVKEAFTGAIAELRFLNQQLNQINLKDGETPWGLTNEFQGRFFEAYRKLLQDLVMKRRKT